ncbi:MAG: Sau3AI family type II restriction endonuclease, partial [Nanoarchaeota archaeon]
IILVYLDKMHQNLRTNYDEKDIDSIYNYAKRLIGHNLKEYLPQEYIFKIINNREVKGKFGQLLQEYYFGIKNNSDSEPDFKEAGLELKTTPIKKLKKGGYVPKERLSLNNINYKNIKSETWEKSHFLSKNETILLIIYLYEQDKNFLEYLIKHVNIWKIEGKDREIIRQDWEKIVNKIRDNKAHELSEGDTFYLGACRKGHLEGLREYSSGSLPAKQRAFSFKLKYMKAILRQIEDSEPLVKEIEDLKKKSFEEIVYDNFKPFLGLKIEEIERRLNLRLNRSAKNYYEMLARRMMGIKAKKIEEFEKAGVTMKIIRLKHNGVPKEDMSFPKFKSKEIAEQEWEESDFFSQLESKFFFVMYQMNKDESEIKFKKAFFWNMPQDDLKEAEKVWSITKRVINEGVKFWQEGESTRNNLPNKSENRISHVRPHGKNKMDVDELPDGRKMTKSCFWLNAKYIKEQI